MEVLFNELSLHKQFSSIDEFQIAIDTMMSARKKLNQFNRELYCHRRNLTTMQITHQLSLQQVIQKLNQNKKREFMNWLTKKGPFWDDQRLHEEDDYFESQNQIVTDNALGEAAYHCFNNNNYQTFSFTPSNWQINPVPVLWHRNNGEIINIDVINHWDVESLEIALQATASPITSWQQLTKDMPILCPNLTFSKNSFEPLYPYPFVDSAAKRIVELLKVLDQFKNCFDDQGQRTDEGHRIYREHFMGDKAWFSDSLDNDFNRKELTFNHPTKSNEKIYCPWHGKIKTPQIRIHFSYPKCADEPLCVPYIGMKITKK